MLLVSSLLVVAVPPASAGEHSVGGVPSPRSSAELRGEGTAPTSETSQTRADTWQHVDVAPTKTSIYVGVVSMSMPTFTRGPGTYTAAYTAKVFPYFFYNEGGTLTVDVSDAKLADLVAGKPIDITGTAVRTDGAKRNVTARATPADSRSGKLDVHVHYSKRIELIFHTTYRFW